MAVEESERTRLGSENDEEGEEEIEGWRKKWRRHYASHHQILLVGEGDFSFSSSLALAFGSASNLTATSLDDYDALIRKYKKAKSNLGKLKKLGASLLHGVDATTMKDHPDLRVRKFDRIIFNFPHAGFHGKEDDMQMIDKHRKLMNGFFRNASQMLRADGEVHVRHKTKAPYCHWKLEELASWNSLELIDQTAFESKNYPGYHQKRGDGWRCDELFPLGPCSSFKFGFYPGAYHRNIVQEIPHRTCYDDTRFRLVPLPGLAPEQHYADVERRTSVGDLYLFDVEQLACDYLEERDRRNRSVGDLYLFDIEQLACDYLEERDRRNRRKRRKSRQFF